MLAIFDALDIKAETCLLDASEWDSLRKANDFLSNLKRDEEAKWAHRVKVKFIQEGGNNTKYFHLIANGKHIERKKFS